MSPPCWRGDYHPSIDEHRFCSHCLVMADPALTAKMQALLSADDSAHRLALTNLAFDALMSQEAKVVLGVPQLVSSVLSALTRENAQRVANEHVVPATERIGATLTGAEQRLRELLPEASRTELERIIASGKGPRFGW